MLDTRLICIRAACSPPLQALRKVFATTFPSAFDVLTLANNNDARAHLESLQLIQERVECLLVDVAVASGMSLVRDIIVHELGGFRLVLLSAHSGAMIQRSQRSIVFGKAFLGATANALVDAPWLFSETARLALASNSNHDRKARCSCYKEYSQVVAAEPLAVACHDLKYLVRDANPAGVVCAKELAGSWRSWRGSFSRDIERSLVAGAHRLGASSQRIERLIMRIDHEMLHSTRSGTSWELFADLLEQLVQFEEDLIS